MTKSQPDLIDRFGHGAAVSMRHSIVISAARERVWAALWSLDISRIWFIKLLFALRTLPALIFKPGSRPDRRRRSTLAAIQDAGFGKLVEAPGREVVFGVLGRFWSPVHNIDPFDAGIFDGPAPAGRCRAVWGFALGPGEGGGTLLTTETRVDCGDTASRRKFRTYWALVRPFSGLIRHLMLREIRRMAEAPGEGSD